MKQVLNKSEAKLVARILKVVASRMEGRDKSGLWTADDDTTAYLKETFDPSRGVVIDLTHAEARTLARVIGAKPTDPATLTPREEGLLGELRKFIKFVDETGLRSPGVKQYADRFREIADKMEGK